MKKIFASIWVLALIIAVPVILFMPSLFEKYVVEEISREPKQKLFKNSEIYFADLNNDSKKESIEIGELVLDNKEKIIVEFADRSPMIVFKGSGNKPGKALYFGDTDKNGYNELFGFSFSGDSLFLNHAQPYADNREYPLPEAKSYFVPFYYPQDGREKWTGVDGGHFYDVDNDGFDEFIFTVKYYGEFSVKAIVIFDNQSQTFAKSELIGDRNMNLQWIDVDDNGTPELVADGNGAGATVGSIYPFSDGSPYLKVYNADLKFKFEPVKFPKGRITTLPVKVKSQTFFYTIWQKDYNREEYGIYKTNATGNIIDSVKFNSKDPVYFPWIKTTTDGNIYVQAENEEIAIFDTGLNLKKKIAVSNNQEPLFVLNSIDINEDGVDEFLCMKGKSREFHLYSDNFSEKIEFGKELKMIQGSEWKLKKNLFYLQNDDYYLTYRFEKNPYRLLQFPVYLGIYLLALLLVFIIRKTQEYTLREKYELKNKIRDLQLGALKNQLDPHFVYNTFNTIASVVKRGEAEEAYDMIVQFSKMVRNNLGDSMKTETTLQKEIEFVADYMKLQQFRFKDALEYNINIDESVDLSTLVPKLIIQIHVENAIKHGIRNSKQKGIIQVNIKKHTDGIKIEIEDNGIGREEAKAYSSASTGLGLKTIQQIIDLSNQKRESRISQYLHDLKDDAGNARGTNVVLQIRA